MADILTGGRVVFGVGRGYHTREVEPFGSPLRDQVANRELFEEQVEIVFKAFNQRSFSHHGKYYDIPPRVPYRGYQLEEITLVPRPRNRPVECWQPIQGGTPRALDFMAKHGIKGTIGGGVAEGGAMDSVVVGYRDALIRWSMPILFDLSQAELERLGVKPGDSLLLTYQQQPLAALLVVRECPERYGFGSPFVTAQYLSERTPVLSMPAMDGSQPG